jgi:hypothetical protein
LEKLSFQRTVEATANRKMIQGLVRASEEQLSLFQALNVPVPQHKHLANPAL